MVDLHKLADLIRERNLVDDQIAALIVRPAERSHIGEYIGAAIFGIELHRSANNKGSDGLFTAGPLITRTVNIKWYGRQEYLLDMKSDGVPDYYLVLMGLKGGLASSRGTTNPLLIESVFLFNAADLFSQGCKPGVAASVRKYLWEAAEIYPVPRNNALVLTDEQRSLLSVFARQAPT